MTTAKRGICRLKSPRDECGETARLLLKLVETLQVIDAMLVVLSHAEHHRRSRSHADLMRCPVYVQPVFSQALQASNLVTDLIIQNLSTATRDRIQTGIPQPHDRIANTQVA